VSSRRPVDEVAAAGRPELELRAEDRETISDLLADLLVHLVEREPESA
jgi:hypothetical protein